MHIDSLHRPIHRHSVVLPLFLVLFALSALPSQSRLGASLQGGLPVQATSADQTFLLPSGIAGILERGGQLTGQGNDLTLVEGTMIARASGLLTVHVADTTFAALRGSFIVSLSSDALSVAALDISVLMAHGSATLIVPPGKQARWPIDAFPSDGSVSAMASFLQSSPSLPEDQQTRWLTKLRSLPETKSEDASMLQSPTFVGMLLSPFELPAAQKRREKAAFAKKIEQVRELASIGDTAALNEFLRTSRIGASPFTASAFDDIAPTLPPASLLSLLPMINEPIFKTIALFHPSTRDVLWSDPLHMPNDPVLLIAFPASDTTSEAALPSTVTRWQSAMSDALASSNTPVELFTDLLRASRPLLQACNKYGFVERKERYTHIFQVLSEPYDADLSPEAIALLGEWNDDSQKIVSDDALPEASSSSSSKAPVTPADIAHAKEILMQAGALFSLQTVFTADTDGTIRVTGIGFGVHRFDFSFDPVESQALRISRDGIEMPFPMPLQKFLEWAKK